MAHLVTRTLPVPNGVVFLFDPSAIVDVPTDTGAGPVLATEDCLSLWTVHDSEGLTTLTLTDEAESSTGQVVFEGALSTPGKRLAFNTSGCEPVLEIGLESVRPHLVYADDAAEPSRLICCVCPQAR